MIRSFPIQAAGKAALITLLAVAGLCLALAVYFWSIRLTHPLVMSIGALTTLALAGLFCWFAVARRGATVVIEGDQMCIAIPLYGRTIKLDQVVRGSVRAVLLGSDTDYRLTWRTNGLDVPGYQLGWFRGQGIGRVLASVTGKEVLAFRTKDDYPVLLSMADRAGLERAMRAAVEGA